VFDTTGSVRHFPFFTELASLDEGDRAWRAVSAGLVALRLVDAWIEEGSAVIAADGWGVRSVEAAIEEMPEGLPARAILGSILGALKESRGGDLHSIAPRLMAYARSLDLDAKWALAADVYETVIAHAHPVEESDVVITAHLRLAFCQRNLGALDDATASYATASAIANDSDDMFGILRAQIGAAKIAIERGNMPSAERLLDDVIVRASQREDLTDVHAMALQDRAGVAFFRGRYDAAEKLAYQSLELTRDQVDRDRLLSDIALAFSKLGVHSAARDAYLIVEATAQEQYSRWAASMNLMELAAREGAMPVFERYRRSLMTMPFPPAQRAQYHMQTAEGYEALSEYEAAAHAGHRAREIAEQFGFHQVVFEAEALVRRVAQGQRTATRVAEVAVPEPLQTIVDSISKMRHLMPR
jgi:tetratricopeptide (TPR) repeat protein